MSPIPGAGSLRRARRAAAKRELAASLTIDDWNQTCADMEYRCAYCGTAASMDASLDHFLPMACGGGTTVTNCVLSCRECNRRKGNDRPETFLSHDPERLARLQYYLAHRRSWPSTQPFWSFALQREEEYPLNRDEMQSTSYSLMTGAELSLYNDERHTVLQLRYPAAPETDPLASGFQVAALLAPSECVALAASLLLYASPKVEDKRLPE
ncbi:MAG: HNH endonuclease [Ktedonobacteraceae bacterium]|nr:HNH endonuclease [Ktedonobacteraceae bacterium]